MNGDRRSALALALGQSQALSEVSWARRSGRTKLGPARGMQVAPAGIWHLLKGDLIGALALALRQGRALESDREPIEGATVHRTQVALVGTARPSGTQGAPVLAEGEAGEDYSRPRNDSGNGDP